MEIKTLAVVLNKIKYNDTSYIANLITREVGKVTVFIRIPKAKKAVVKPGLFYPLNVIETEISQKASRNIQNIKHCSTAFSTYNICTDVFKSSIAQFIAEVVGKTCSDNQADEDLFEYLLEIIKSLEKNDEPSHNLHLLFLKDYARLLGFEITNNYSEHTPFFSLREGMFLPVYTTDEESMSPNLSKMLSDLFSLDTDSIKEFKPGYENRKQLLSKLLLYYKIHLDEFPEIKSLSVLNSVFTD